MAKGQLAQMTRYVRLNDLGSILGSATVDIFLHTFVHRTSHSFIKFVSLNTLTLAIFFSSRQVDGNHITEVSVLLYWG